MDSWQTGRFIVCSHTCRHTVKRVRPEFEHLFIWPVNTGGRSYDHCKNAKFHDQCTEECPGYSKGGPRNAAGRRPATLAETARGVIIWRNLADNHFDGLQVREKEWIRKVRVGEELVNPQLRALWLAAPSLPVLFPLPYSNFGIGPDPQHLQFQDIPTHLSQQMRPFNVNAALNGLPAMAGSTVPGPGPVLCGYEGFGEFLDIITQGLLNSLIAKVPHLPTRTLHLWSLPLQVRVHIAKLHTRTAQQEHLNLLRARFLTLQRHPILQRLPILQHLRLTLVLL